MPHAGLNLAAIAREEMVHAGFDPDFSPDARSQVAALKAKRSPVADGELRDLRYLPWSSIDNDTSRDLDQIEFAERSGDGIRVLVGIADVDLDVAVNSPIDRHAASQTTSVYAQIKTFPMIPEELSTDLTSLCEGCERAAVIIEMTVAPDGAVTAPNIYRALVRNRFQLAYPSTGAWFEKPAAAPPKIASSSELRDQLTLQDEAARALRAQRHKLGALDFQRVETEAVIANGDVKGIVARPQNRATALIEDFMIAANEVMAQTLVRFNRAAIRRVVRTPKRWPRIVDLAREHGAMLPPQPDSEALAGFLREQQAKDPLHYPDLSLAIIKLLGSGEYVLVAAGGTSPGHFALAAHDYTHSTAPNRRFADLVTQRLIKAALAGQPSPYSDDELAAIAANCTQKEDAARKVERHMGKRLAALAFHDRIGAKFQGVVTGNTPSGVFVRTLSPPIEGRLIRGEQGVDVGDKITVTLLNTDPYRGFIDFGR